MASIPTSNCGLDLASGRSPYSKFLRCDREIFREVYSYLSEYEQNQMDKVAEAVSGCLLSWSLFHKAEKLRAYIRLDGFGAAKWERYFGKVERIPLPLKIYEVLEGPDSFSPGKKVKDTHFLFYLPTAVDGNPLTLNHLGKLVEEPKEESGGNPSKYLHFPDEIKTQYGDKKTSAPCWVFMGKDIIEGSSRDRSFMDQFKRIVLHPDYKRGLRIPQLLDVVAALFLRHVMTGERLLPRQSVEDGWIFTRCGNSVSVEGSMSKRVVVGGFASEGLSIMDDKPRYPCKYGLVSFWKFPGAQI